MTASAAVAAAPALPDSLARTIVDDLVKPIAVVDRDFRIAFANKCFRDFVKLPWQEVEGHLVETVIEGACIEDLIKEAQLSCAIVDYQGEFNIGNLGRKNLMLRVHPLPSSNRFLAFIGMVDITDRELTKSTLTLKMEAAKRAEVALRNQSRLLMSVMESSGDGIFVADAAGYCVLWNPAAEKLLGMNPGHISREKWVQKFGLFLPDKVTPYPTKELPLSKALKGEPCGKVEIWICTAARPMGFWMSVTARPLDIEQGGAVAAFRDITFEKNAKAAMTAQAEEIKRSNRDLEQFASVAAHDLQEPLRMVSSYVQLLAKRYKGRLDSDADDFIGFATEGAKRMSLLINDLLNYSRVGRAELSEELVDCEKLMAEVLNSLKEKALDAHAQITHSALPTVKASFLQLSRVFQNLLSNAIKFRGKEPPQIHISAQRENGHWLFSVADNGIGIGEEYTDRVFVIFQRLHSREEYEGTGIGLAICKKIVEQRGGKIWITPGQSQGTTINFTWPDSRTRI